MDADGCERQSLLLIAATAQAQHAEAEADDRVQSTDLTRLRLSAAVSRLKAIRERLQTLGLRQKKI